MNTMNNDFINRISAKRFPIFELFKYGVTEQDCINEIKAACAFFGMPMPASIDNLTYLPYGQTMFVNRNRESFADDILCYDLAELKRLGVTGKHAFTLIMTHENAHRLMQNTPIEGVNNGQWEQELIADFFMGVRAGIEGIPHSALDAVRSGLKDTPGAKTHPTGKLRSDIISYGYTWVGNMDLIHHKKRTMQEYYNIFMEWLQKHKGEIRQAQVPFYGY